MTTWETAANDASAWVVKTASAGDSAAGDSYVKKEYVERDYIETDVWAKLKQVTTWQPL